MKGPELGGHLRCWKNKKEGTILVMVGTVL